MTPGRSARLSERFGKSTLAKPTGNLEEALAQLRTEFAASLPDRAQKLDDAWHEPSHRDWDSESLNAAYHQVHSLAGAAETFGFTDLGGAARALNDHLHGIVSSGQDATAAVQAEAQAYYDAIEVAFEDAKA